ncbi:MAG: hypothetical protein HY791_39540 [Deltaproteobacteria bacterium]|nr:hypothetical protein [Deltaproteobacteria bacterium]
MSRRSEPLLPRLIARAAELDPKNPEPAALVARAIVGMPANSADREAWLFDEIERLALRSIYQTTKEPVR